ncbi:hypothetical protein SAMN04489733_6024 [Amycolatopsis keratiniphila]|nr:hypothetical protein SAMN04489733_6024 [Amycolatopsis keratiniphila]
MEQGLHWDVQRLKGGLQDVRAAPRKSTMDGRGLKASFAASHAAKASFSPPPEAECEWPQASPNLLAK